MTSYPISYPVTWPVTGKTSGPFGGGANLNLSASTWPANSALNTVIGTLSVSGGSGVYTYSFTSNPGTLFNISGSSLRDNTGTNGAGSYSVTIQANNGAGSIVTKAFLLTATGAVATPTYYLYGF